MDHADQTQDSVEEASNQNGNNEPEIMKSSSKKKKKLKRSAPADVEVTPDVKRARPSLTLQGLITPVSKLNELAPGLNYELISQEGPPHNPLFTVKVVVKDETFIGTGKSKKLAKHEAALKALEKFSDSVVYIKQEASSPLTNGNSALSQPNVHFNSFSSNNDSGLSISPSNSSKNALAVINEMRPGLQWKEIFEGEQMVSKFFASVTIDGEEFTGRGISKKAAKLAAASAYLAKIGAALRPKCDLQLNTNAQTPTSGILTIHLADNIARAIENKFLSMASKIPTLAKYKVLAGIVMTRDDSCGNLEVVSFGTGTKCINGGKLSLEGCSVNDCHGEILSRRALLSFFYHNLQLLSNADTAQSSIFEKCEDINGYQLKTGINFFLYINTAPCGDGRLFSPQEEKEQPSIADKHPNRINRGLLRTKIESGEGTVKLDENKKLQTWDGIIQGERLLTMSCSDKIAKWNTVGLQGALLSHFIKPVYLTGIVIGSLFSPTHIYRAVIGRLEGTLQALPPPYRLNKPLLATTSSITERLATKTPNHAVVWSAEMSNLEALNAITGRQLDTNTTPSLSKRKLFEKFLKLVGKISNVTNLGNPSESLSITVYSRAKAAATLYQEAKEQTFRAFSQGRLGEWLKKPSEVDEFEIAPSPAD